MHKNYPVRQRAHGPVAVAVSAPAADHRLTRAVAFVLAVALLATALAGLFGTRALALDSDNIRIAKALSNAYAEVVDKVSPGVVGIETERVVRSSSGIRRDGDDIQEFFERFFGPQGRSPRIMPSPEEMRPQRRGGIGSGV
ncbi:MAG: hypothetical protein LIP77_12245, partial [Planctomycetes bacterium]|nr:hypothetical protein [Planctomycetota bacterium]